MGKLDGKVVIVTGASRGIGAEIARVFASEGGKVVCAARTMREGEHKLEGSLETTVAGIKEAGGEATVVAVNISEPEECEKLIEAAHDAYGPLDVLVNNAALTYFIPVKDYPVNRWMRSPVRLRRWPSSRLRRPWSSAAATSSAARRSHNLWASTSRPPTIWACSPRS